MTLRRSQATGQEPASEETPPADFALVMPIDDSAVNYGDCAASYNYWCSNFLGLILEGGRL